MFKQGPACVLVGLVVFVFPGRAAAVAAVAGEAGLAVATVFAAVGALYQFGVARGFAPMALNASAGLTQIGGSRLGSAGG